MSLVPLSRFCAFALFWLIVCNSIGAIESKVYYMPFSAITYYSITVENIESSIECPSVLSQAQLTEIRNVLDSRKHTSFNNFMRNQVRLLVTDDRGARIFVDREGGVLLDGAQFQLSPESFSKLQGVLKRIVKHYGCPARKEPT